MSDVTFRKASIEDYKIVTDIFIESFIGKKIEPDRYQRLCDYYKAVINSKVTFFTILELDNNPIALGGETRYKGSSVIGYIGVKPQFRKKGFGTLIFNEILNEAKRSNPMVELFSNPGADTIYRRSNFKEEYLVNIYDLNPTSNKINENIVTFEEIHNWILDLDFEALGYDRSSLLFFLKDHRKAELIGIKNQGFAFYYNNKIGPIIVKSHTIALCLIDFFLKKGNLKIIMPEMKETIMNDYSPVKTQTCIKMSFGDKLKQKIDWIYGFNAFATG
jgi:GNAT superfamily N-acetyltransferase